MQTTRVKKGASKVRHLGRHKAKILRYYEVTYPLRKLRRIIRNNKESEAKAWAMKHGVMPMFDRLTA
jgi:hypothetical protein